MPDRAPLDLDAIMARARKAEVDTVNTLRHDVAAVIDALVGDSFALVARVRELEKVAEQAQRYRGLMAPLLFYLRRALAEAGYDAKP